MQSPRANPPDPPVLDEDVLTIDLDVVRLTLHVLAATIWVGGQIVLLALMGPLRRSAPDAIAPAARVFAWVAWPAYAVLIVTGVWLLADAGKQSDAFRTTLMVKMVFVLLSGSVPRCTPWSRTHPFEASVQGSDWSAGCAPCCSGSRSSRSAEPSRRQAGDQCERRNTLPSRRDTPTQRPNHCSVRMEP